MVAAPFIWTAVVLEDGETAHFAAPVDDGGVEEPALFEVFDEGGGGLVGFAGAVWEGGADGTVVVP